MFKVRLLSGIILIVLAVIFLYFGGPLLDFVLIFISVVGLIEYYHAVQIAGAFKIAGIITVPVLYIPLYFNYSNHLLLVVLLSFMAHMAIYVFSYPRFNLVDISEAFFGIIYVPVMLSFIYLTRALPMGVFLVWLIFICSWGCDTCAYCVGMLFGKHKMSPVLSPKKSVEGAVGGIVGTMIISFVFLFVFKNKIGIEGTNIIIISLLSAIGAFLSMVGDLCASAIKRNYNIKDYGNLIPGHGGVLDRFDSVIITAPLIYCLGLYFV